MNPSSPSGAVLVVGSDCPIGKLLVTRWQTAGRKVLGTTRRRELVGANTLYLDLTEDLETWQCPPNVRVAILCAGISKLEICRQDPNGSFRVNVTGIVTLARKLSEQGVFIVYPSTNHVFDGSIPLRKPEESTCPVTEYGVQKAEAEKQLLRLGDSVAVVRTAKIIGPEQSLFAKWAESLRRGQEIHPFSDMRLAPVPLSLAASVLHRVTEQRLPGVLQLSGDRDISYEEAARIGARVLGASEKLIQPILAAEAQIGPDPLFAHTTLNMDLLKTKLGVVPPEAYATVAAAFSLHEPDRSTELM